MTAWLTRFLLMRKLNIHIYDKTKQKAEFGIKVPLKTDDDPMSFSTDTAKDISSTENIFLSTEKLCRLCMKPAQIHLFQKVNEFDVLGAIRVVTNLAVSATQIGEIIIIISATVLDLSLSCSLPPNTDGHILVVHPSIKLDDSYPKYACAACIEDLKSAFAFKMKCQETDFKYKQLSRFDYTLNAQPDFVRHDFNQLIEQMSRRREETQMKREPERKEMKILKKKKILKTAVKMRRSPNQFICIACDIPFYDREALQAHREQRACARRPCPVCCKLVFYLPRHMHRMHRRGPFHKCAQCGKECRTLGMLKSHMHVHSDRFDYNCHLCAYRGKQRAYLQLHMRTHTGERPYLCAQCPATFVNCRNLRKHSLVHSNKQFQCTKCNKYFRLAKTLRDHDEAAHKQIRHPCNICGKIFTYRSRLLRHELRIHNREKHKLNSATTQQAAASNTDTITTQAAPLMRPSSSYEDVDQQVEETIVSDELLAAANSEIVIFECD